MLIYLYAKKKCQFLMIWLATPEQKSAQVFLENSGFLSWFYYCRTIQLLTAFCCYIYWCVKAFFYKTAKEMNSSWDGVHQG